MLASSQAPQQASCGLARTAAPADSPLGAWLENPHDFEREGRHFELHDAEQDQFTNPYSITTSRYATIAIRRTTRQSNC